MMKFSVLVVLFLFSFALVAKEPTAIHQYPGGMCATFSAEDNIRVVSFCAKENSRSKKTDYFFVVSFIGKSNFTCDKFYIKDYKESTYSYNDLPSIALTDGKAYYLTIHIDLVNSIRDGNNVRIYFKNNGHPEMFTFDRESFNQVRFVSLYESVWP